LAGAVAYSWGFAREAVAGITPIQEMISIEDQETPALTTGTRAALPREAGPGGLRFLKDPSPIPAHFAHYFDSVLPAFGASSPLLPMRTPLLFSGFPAAVVDRLAPALSRIGIVAVQGGSSPRDPAVSDGGITPGSGVGIRLVRGDIEIAAICTVTYKDGDRVLACGHPLLNLGPTDLSMTTATVNGLFPALP